MTQVSIIGLGAMGAALAACLLENDYEVTVWNRSREKAVPLVAAGATLAASAENAIAASPITIVCIKNHLETFRLLEPIKDVWQGKTICDLSTGDSVDADRLVSFLQSNGADYMIGIINAYPSGIGKDSTTIITVAVEETWTRHAGVIKTLGGRSTYIGTEPSALTALFAALFTTRQGFMFGMIYGALVCEKAGVPLQVFSDQIPVSIEMNNNYYKTFAATVPDANYDNPEASMATYAAALDDALSTFKSNGTPAELPQLFCDMVHKAMKDGLAEKQLTALVQHMLK